MEEQNNNNEKQLIQYAPIALMVIAILLQWNFFVRPQDLEKVHREIIQEVSQTYVTKNETNQIQKQLSDMNSKMDKIYDYIINNKK